MRLAFIAVLAACAGTKGGPAPTSEGMDTGGGTADSGGTTESKDSAAPIDTAQPVDTGEPALVTWACPEGMVSVTAPDEVEPAYCIDVYENQVVGVLGDVNQHTGAGVPTTAVALSTAGVVPITGLSYGQASAACANTSVRDGTGAKVGRKRLATSSEWEDAADGVLGSGGMTYPYGDTWSEGVCATPLEDGSVVISGLQVTGSYPDCVSPFGVYDAVGNAWEWTDSEIVLDVDAWFAAAEAEGVDVTLGPGDTLVAGPMATASLQLRVQGLDAWAPEIGEDGRLLVGPEAFAEVAPGLSYAGFLVLQDGTESLAFLPVWFDVPIRESHADEPVTTTDEHLLVLWEAEGATVPDKRGCAYYVGDATACRIEMASPEHMYDFIGTISFRCVADPFPSAP